MENQENTFFFTLGDVRFCFPFDINRVAYREGQEDRSLLGVLEPWADKKMTEHEATMFLCKLLRKRPKMPHAMSVTVSVMKHNKSGVSYYQTLRFRTDEKEAGEFSPSPIQWEKP